MSGTSESGNARGALYWPQQSPIVLRKDEAIRVSAPGLLSINYRGRCYEGKFVEKDGHRNFELRTYPAGKEPKGYTAPMLTVAPHAIPGLGGMKARLVKIHVHLGSEHDMEGEQRALEVHLVHEIEDPQHGSTLIVLGVVSDLTRKQAEGPVSRSSKKADAVASAELQQLLDAWTGPAPATAGRGKESYVSLPPAAVIPSLEEWFRYEGSLTTPEYDEIVSWFVLNQPLTVNSRTLRLLKGYACQTERETRPLNRRYVLRNFPAES